MFLALVRLGFLPQWLAERNQRYGTPHRAIAISVVVPVIVVLATRGQMELLGDMYSFGLLGAFTLTSVGIDRLRAQEKQPRPRVLDRACSRRRWCCVAWGVNLVEKTKATLFGGSVTADRVRRSRTRCAGAGSAATAPASPRPRRPSTRPRELETATEVVTLEEALEMKAMYPSITLVAVRAANLRLFQEALARARGAGDAAVYVIYVDEVPGLFFPPKAGPSREARQVLQAAVDYFKQAGFTAVPVWRMAHDAGASVAGAARKLGVEAVMVGTSQRNAVWHLLRGNVLKSLVSELPPTTRVWICN